MRYKQTVIGVPWALIRPVVTIIVFTVIFGKFGRMPAVGFAYPVLVGAATPPWQFFASALSEASNGLIMNANMSSKIYFPRIVMPASAVIVSHNMEAIDRLTPRWLCLSSGKLCHDSPMSDVARSYLQHATQGDRDLARFQTSSMPGTVALPGLWAETTDGVKSTAFRQGEPFRIVLRVEAAKRLDCDFAVVIENSQQPALFTTHLTNLAGPVATDGTRFLAAKFLEPLLRRGDYLTSIAVFSPNKQSFYDLVLHFPLLEIAGTIGSSFPDDIRWGDLYVPIP
jgi:hypothetical protein